jgi:hypothetical protein
MRHEPSTLEPMRLFRALRLVLADDRIPRPLRWLGGFALLPIPGPVDEAVLLLLLPFVVVYREPMKEAWKRAGGDGHTSHGR